MDTDLAAAYRRAHEIYLSTRDAIAPLGTDVTAGGMPERVKCLHALLAHSLAAGPGVNPLGDETLDLVGQWWPDGDCAPNTVNGFPLSAWPINAGTTLPSRNRIRGP